jgi:hypothetical protein
MGDRRTESFTMIFGGNIRHFKGNPLTAETPFGVAYAIGVGDAFEDMDAMRDLLNQVLESRAVDYVERAFPGWAERAEKVAG